LHRLNLERREASFRFSWRRDAMVAEMYTTRPSEALEAFESEMETELQRMPLLADSVRERCLDGYYRIQWSNSVSLRQRMDAICDARRKARDFATMAVDAGEFAPYCDELRTSLPALEERPRRYQWNGGDDAA
jgi:hypothetical protein